MQLTLQILTLFNAQASDIDCYYTSRLPGEPAEGANARLTGIGRAFYLSARWHLPWAGSGTASPLHLLTADSSPSRRLSHGIASCLLTPGSAGDRGHLRLSCARRTILGQECATKQFPFRVNICNSLIPLEPAPGFEPGTYGLQDRSGANLHWSQQQEDGQELRG